eukprot:1178815-Prymnesium_polylepis.2
MRVAMRHCGRGKQRAAAVEQREDGRRCLIAERGEAFDGCVRRAGHEAAVEADRVHARQAMLERERVVVLPVARRYVHDARALVALDKRRRKHWPLGGGRAGVRGRQWRRVIEREEIGTAEQLQHGEWRGQLRAERRVERRHARRRDHELARAAIAQLRTHPRVLCLRCDGERDVTKERPRRRRPHEQRRAGEQHLDRRERQLPPGGGQQLAARLEGDVRAGVRHVVVAAWLVELMRGVGGACLRAEGQDLVPLVQQTLFVQRAQRPPLGLHVLCRRRHKGWRSIGMHHAKHNGNSSS